MKVAIEKELNLNKSNWKTVKFGDVVTEPKESTRDIVGDGFQHIVGLEHIDTENIHLKRWMQVGGETTFSKVFRKGDVLFGRRRAYLKKAALADFDGVCSGDITVFRTKPNLIPELLPFIVNNERFFDYAIKHSAGGLSPRVKFKDLANYEFLLPPKEEQRKLAELLWAMDNMIEKEKRLLKKVDVSIKSFLNKIYRPNSDYINIKDACLILDNLRKPLNNSQRNDDNGNVPYYGANGLAGYVDEFIFDETIVLVAEDGGNFKEYSEKAIAYVVEGKSWVNNHAHVIKFRDRNIDVNWLFYQLVHRNIIKHITGTTRLKLTKGELENIKIWLPSKTIIDEYCTKIKELFMMKDRVISTIQTSKNLQKSLINQIF